MTDMTQPARPASRMTSPAALIGAGVLVASLGAAGGWMVHSSRAPAPEAAAPQLALAPNETVVPATVPQAPAPQAVAPQAVAPQATTPAPAHTAPAHHATRPHEPAHETAQGTATGSGTSNATPLPTQKAAVCDNCGVIEGVRAVQHKGQGSGLGAVGGAVLGGVLGHQMGGGKGKSAMTVLGAVGGGLAGNEVEKRMKASTEYEVKVRMDDGSVRTFMQKTQPTPGARVVVEGNGFRTVSSKDNGQGV